MQPCICIPPTDTALIMWLNAEEALAHLFFNEHPGIHPTRTPSSMQLATITRKLAATFQELSDLCQATLALTPSAPLPVDPPAQPEPEPSPIEIDSV
jgi:hypothetical protein